MPHKFYITEIITVIPQLLNAYLMHDLSGHQNMKTIHLLKRKIIHAIKKHEKKKESIQTSRACL